MRKSRRVWGLAFINIRGNMLCVDISARIIRWPDSCACCCRNADTSVSIAFSKSRGTEVIRTTTVAWRVPYCNRCLNHVRLSKEIADISQNSFVVHGSLVVCVLGIITSLVVSFNGYFISDEIGLRRGLLSLTGTVVTIALTHGFFKIRYERKTNQMRIKAIELGNRKDSFTCSSCADKDSLAVSYGGWYGTVHRFHFANTRFASQFRSLNKGKCF